MKKSVVFTDIGNLKIKIDIMKIKHLITKFFFDVDGEQFTVKYGKQRKMFRERGKELLVDERPEDCAQTYNGRDCVIYDYGGNVISSFFTYGGYVTKTLALAHLKDALINGKNQTE